MTRKKQSLPFIENVEITGVAAEGKAICRVDERVIFVPFAAPGDIVDLQIIRKKRNYAEARIVNMRQPSPLRVEPFCPHFGVCGGCKWQHLPYEYQLQFKQQQVEDNLVRIGKIALPEILPIKGSARQRAYRNKLEYTFSNRSWLTTEQMNEDTVYTDRNALGFHIPGMFDKVLDIKYCGLQDDISNRIRLDVRAYAIEKGLEFFDLIAQSGLMRNLIVRTTTTGEVMLIVVFYENKSDAINDLLQHIADTFPEITSLLYIINHKANDTITDQEVICFKGRDYIIEEMEGLRFKIGPKSFYQTNSEQAYELYKVVRSFAQLTGSELVYDLYTGTGTIANFVSRQARQVVGIEYVPEAIEDAKSNAAYNGISNTLFYAGDMKDLLTAEFIERHGKPDVIITDPPRAGMHEDVVKAILYAAPKRIVYVSCNPATQARDLSLLDNMYKVTAVQPVDMFPHTHHVENVVCLEKREKIEESII